MKCIDESQEYYSHESWGKAVYREIVEPERIVYVDSFSDAEGNIVKEMPETLITLTFVEHEGKTKLINHAQYASADALKTVMDMGMLQGMTTTGTVSRNFWNKLSKVWCDDRIHQHAWLRSRVYAMNWRRYSMKFRAVIQLGGKTATGVRVPEEVVTKSGRVKSHLSK